MRAVIFWICLATIAFISAVNATSPPACQYDTLEGKSEFLGYFPAVKKGHEYIDYGSNKDKVCVQRATCQETYQTKVEKCSDFKVTCENKSTFEGDFPACCVKC